MIVAIATVGLHDMPERRASSWYVRLPECGIPVGRHNPHERIVADASKWAQPDAYYQPNECSVQPSGEIFGYHGERECAGKTNLQAPTSPRGEQR